MRSGVIDSGIVAITMPGFGTSSRTRDNAHGLMEALGVTVREIPIGPAVRAHFADIGHDESQHDLTYENAQARERTQILMDVANQVGGFVVGTGDLSEAGARLDDLQRRPHVDVPRERRRAEDARALPRHVGGETSASATRSARCCTTSWTRRSRPSCCRCRPTASSSRRPRSRSGPYELHDFFLYHAIRSGARPAKVLVRSPAPRSATITRTT